MEAMELYDQLERDFILPGLRDNWADDMAGIKDHVSANFMERSMGLTCDFTKKIGSVYSAVFPSGKVMNQILDDGVTDAMLFVHHPMIWDIRGKSVFSLMDTVLLKEFRDRRISIYNLHVPLDNFSEYGTSKTLADALAIDIEKPFALYYGGLCGVIGRTGCKTIGELSDVFSQAVGHRTALYQYGDQEIRGGRVAVAAGGGNDPDVVNEMIENEISVLVTGISAKTEWSAKVHDLEKKNRINVLGGTHYSTEKFACIRMCDYFRNLGLPSVFIEDEPVYEDM